MKRGTAATIWIPASNLIPSLVFASGSGLKEREKTGKLLESQKIRIGGTGSSLASAQQNAAVNAMINIAGLGNWTYWPVGEPNPGRYDGGHTGTLTSTQISAEQTPGPGLPQFWPWVVVIEVYGTATKHGWVPN